MDRKELKRMAASFMTDGSMLAEYREYIRNLEREEGKDEGGRGKVQRASAGEVAAEVQDLQKGVLRERRLGVQDPAGTAGRAVVLQLGMYSGIQEGT